MRLTFTVFLFLMSISLSGQRFSQRKIGRMLKKIPAFEQTHIALSIEPLKTSKPKAFYQRGNYMTPASNTKLLTFLAAIQSFDSFRLSILKKRTPSCTLKPQATPYCSILFIPIRSWPSFLSKNIPGTITLQDPN